MKWTILMVTFVVAASSYSANKTNRCSDPDSVCALYYKCNSTKSMSEGLTHQERESNRRECGSYIKSCCPKTQLADETLTKTSGCGWRNPEGVGFEVTSKNMNETLVGEFPWMALIFQTNQVWNKSTCDYICGAVLIHPEIVMTAAQCVSDKSVDSLRVRVGEWDVISQLELYPHQDISVVEVVIHKDFSLDSLGNNIALMFLARPANIAANVNTVCLPLPNTSFLRHKHCVITSWGKNRIDGKYQVVLQKVEVPIVPKDQCVDKLRGTHFGEGPGLHQSLICAGGEAGKDLCEGSEGSPLVCPMDDLSNQYQLAGLYVTSIDCGRVPNLYTSVAELRRWVDEQLISRRLSRSYYIF